MVLFTIWIYNRLSFAVDVLKRGLNVAILEIKCPKRPEPFTASLLQSTMVWVGPATGEPGTDNGSGVIPGHSIPVQNIPPTRDRAMRTQPPATTAAAGMVRNQAMRISRTTPHLTAE